jgi:hypothetical protein
MLNFRIWVTRSSYKIYKTVRLSINISLKGNLWRIYLHHVLKSDQWQRIIIFNVNSIRHFVLYPASTVLYKFWFLILYVFVFSWCKVLYTLCALIVYYDSINFIVYNVYNFGIYTTFIGIWPLDLVSKMTIVSVFCPPKTVCI